MRFCRFDDNRLGVVVGDEVRDVTAVVDHLPPLGLAAAAWGPLLQPSRHPASADGRSRRRRACTTAERGPASVARRQSRQDRRGAGQLPAASRRIARRHADQFLVRM